MFFLYFRGKCKIKDIEREEQLILSIQWTTEFSFTTYTVRAQIYVGSYNYRSESVSWCFPIPTPMKTTYSKLQIKKCQIWSKTYSNKLNYINASSQAFPQSCFSLFRSQTSDIKTRQLIKVKFNRLWLRLGKRVIIAKCEKALPC